MSDKLKILIVDDDRDLLSLLKNKLIKNNFECITAEKPQEGLEKAGAYKPNLVLLDLDLPIMSGFGFLREFKHRSQTTNIPVVVLTSYGDKEISQEAINLGAENFLTKSCSEKELLNTINKHVNTSV